MPDFVTQHDLSAIGVSAIILLSCYFIGEVLRRLLNLPGSFSRKSIHIIVAIWGCCAFFMFDHKEMAVVLPVLFALASIHPVRKRIFNFSGITDRFHPGMLYYPISMFLLFWFCWEEHLQRAAIISLLNLGLGDSAAWIIGSRYAKRQYSIGDSKKSYVGATAMLVVCIISTTAVMLYTSSPLTMLDICAVIGISTGATLLEAVCTNGLDNLSVPLGSALLYSLFYQ